MQSMVMTATGLMPVDQFERGEKIVSALSAEASALRDSFADIAALLFEEAHWRALRLEATHTLAHSLDAHGRGAPGVLNGYAQSYADARRLMAAHLIFKALAGQEADIRMLLGLGVGEERPANLNDPRTREAS